jgi:ATP-dependent Clp protease ATP-binding subunit ClpA
VDIELGFVLGRLREQHIALEMTPEAREFLVEKGFDPVFGARPLKRTIQRYIEDPLSEEIISGHFKGRPLVKALRKNEELVFE